MQGPYTGGVGAGREHGAFAKEGWFGTRDWGGTEEEKGGFDGVLCRAGDDGGEFELWVWAFWVV